MSGTKQFRVITLKDWRASLTPELYDYEGGVVQPINANDDDVVVQELLQRGANVYNVTLQVGDTIYIPTGALHGAFNLDSKDIALSYSANFLDQPHAKQIKQHWCQKRLDKGYSNSKICQRLMDSNLSTTGSLFNKGKELQHTHTHIICSTHLKWTNNGHRFFHGKILIFDFRFFFTHWFLHFAFFFLKRKVTKGLQQWKGKTRSVSSKKTKNQYFYWPWVLSHPGYCQKNAIATCPGTTDRCTRQEEL